MATRSDDDLESDGEAWREDPRWLELTLDKRAIALRRMETVKAYLLGKRSAATAAKLATELQIGRSRFYNLCKLWETTGSPLELAPYKNPVVPKKPSIKRERAEEIAAKVDAALSSTSDRTPKTIVAAVSQSWGDAATTPARETIRRFVEQAIAAEQGTRDGTVRREGSEVARAFGEVVVIDHTVVDLFVNEPSLPSRPTLSLAIDLFTGAPVGHALSIGPPTPGMVITALADAVSRTAAFNGVTIQPRIVIASSYANDWTALVRAISASAMVITGRRSATLPFGAPIARLIGNRLGRLRLLARAGHEDTGRTNGFIEGHDPILSLEQARRVVLANVAQVLVDTLGDHHGQPLRFDVLDTVDDPSTR